MKFKLFLAILALTAFAASASAQQDPLDAGAPDSIIAVFAHTPDVASADSSLVVEIYVVNDDPIKSMTCGFQWSPEWLQLVTAEFTPVAAASLDMFHLFYYRGSLDSTNAAQLCQVTGLRVLGATSLMPSGGRTHVATLTFHLDSLLPTDEIVFDYAPSFTAAAFVADNNDEFAPLFGGRVSFFDPSGVNSIGGGLLPAKFDLAQNYPNPFNPVTRISFDLPQKAHTTLTVFNVLGQRVATLIDEDLAPDSYEVEWSGRTDGGTQVASGIYFYRLNADEKVMTKKMMLLK
jgi:hypothetical protein